MKKALLIILGIIVIAAIATVVYMQIVRSDTNTQTNQDTTNTVAATNTTPTNQGTTTVADTTTATTTAPATTAAGENQETVTRIARTFIERYGTYTSKNNYENLTSVYPFMTDDFMAQTKKFIADSQDAATDDSYYAISTKVLNVTITQFEANSAATVTAAASRIETKDTADPAPLTQTATIDLQFVDKTWKVGAVSWQ